MVQRKAVLGKPGEPKRKRTVLKHIGLGSQGMILPLKTPLAPLHFSLSSVKQREDHEEEEERRRMRRRKAP